MPWVLNDPPPKYGAELAECQRYQFPIRQWQLYPVVKIDDNTITIVIPTPVTLRTVPTITSNFAVLDKTTGTTHYGFVPAVNHPSPGYIQVILTKNSHGLPHDISNVEVFCANVGAMVDDNL